MWCMLTCPTPTVPTNSRFGMIWNKSWKIGKLTKIESNSRNSTCSNGVWNLKIESSSRNSTCSNSVWNVNVPCLCLCYVGCIDWYRRCVSWIHVNDVWCFGVNWVYVNDVGWFFGLLFISVCVVVVCNSALLVFVYTRSVQHTAHGPQSGLPGISIRPAKSP